MIQVDANHNANSLWAFRNTIAPAIRDVLGHPYELKRNLERIHIRVLGVPLNHNNPRNPNWQPTDWDDNAFKALRLQFNKFNPPANALDRPRIVGKLMSLKARKEKSCVVVFGVEKNQAALDLLKGGYAELAFSARKCVEHVVDPSRAFCDTCLSPLHFTGLCSNRPRCKYCLGEHLSTKHRCINTSCRTERPAVGRLCMMHDSKKCLNCDGTDYLSGARNCPPRGTPREVDLDDEPNVHINDPTTSGAHQHPRNPTRRGNRALREKIHTPAIVIDSAPSSRPSTPPHRREVTQGSPQPKRAPVTKTYGGNRTIVQVPSSPAKADSPNRVEARRIQNLQSPMIITTIPDSQPSPSTAIERPASAPTRTRTPPRQAIRELPATPSQSRTMTDAPALTAETSNNQMIEEMVNDGTIRYEECTEILSETLLGDLETELRDHGYTFETEDNLHWTHNNQWCLHRGAGEREHTEISAYAVGLHFTHFLYAGMGCLRRDDDREDPLIPCPISTALCELEHQELNRFQNFVVGQTSGGYPTLDIEVREDGTVLVNGIESASQYLTRREGAPIHPNCHCKIPYRENKLTTDCPSDCSCFHRSPMVAYIIVHRDGSIQKMHELDEEVIQAHRIARIAQRRLAVNV